MTKNLIHMLKAGWSPISECPMHFQFALDLQWDSILNAFKTLKYRQPQLGFHIWEPFPATQTVALLLKHGSSWGNYLGEDSTHLTIKHAYTTDSNHRKQSNYRSPQTQSVSVFSSGKNTSFSECQWRENSPFIYICLHCYRADLKYTDLVLSSLSLSFKQIWKMNLNWESRFQERNRYPPDTGKASQFSSQHPAPHTEKAKCRWVGQLVVIQKYPRLCMKDARPASKHNINISVVITLILKNWTPSWRKKMWSFRVPLSQKRVFRSQSWKSSVRSRHQEAHLDEQTYNERRKRYNEKRWTAFLFFFFPLSRERKPESIWKNSYVVLISTRSSFNHNTALAGGNVRSNPENPAESK